MKRSDKSEFDRFLNEIAVGDEIRYADEMKYTRQMPFWYLSGMCFGVYNFMGERWGEFILRSLPRGSPPRGYRPRGILWSPALWVPRMEPAGPRDPYSPAWHQR